MKIKTRHILLLAILAICQCRNRNEPVTEPKPIPHDISPVSVNTELKINGNADSESAQENFKPKVIPPSPTLQKELRDYVNRWNELPSQTTGKDLIAKQRELAYQAVGKLAGGAELTQFLQFLKNKGAADLHKELVEGALVS